MRLRNKMLPLLGMAALLALTGEGTPQTRVTLSDEIWVIGDSIGVGIGGALARAKVRTAQDAINSTTARSWLQRLRAPGFVWPQWPRFVVVSLGTNDAQSAELRREFSVNALAIIEELTRRGHVVCWVLPPSEASLIPRPADLERLTAAGIVVIWQRVSMADAWHPTAAGYDAIAGVIAAAKAARS
jgi:hypothetical protein